MRCATCGGLKEPPRSATSREGPAVRVSFTVAKIPRPASRESAFLRRPRARQLPDARPLIDAGPLSRRAAEQVEGGHALHELVRLLPPPELGGRERSCRGDAGDAGAERAERLPVDDEELRAVAALAEV